MDKRIVVGVLAFALASRGAAAPDTLRLLVEQAQTAEQQNKLDEAIALYKRILQLRPGWAAAELNLGLVYHSRGNHPAAIRTLTDALRHQPDLNSALLFRGSSYYQRDRADDAIRDLTEYLRRQPDDPEALPVLGAALISTGQPAQAALAYAALGRVTNDPGAYFRLADAYARVAGQLVPHLGEEQAEQFRLALTAPAAADQSDFETATRDLISMLSQTGEARRLGDMLNRLARSASARVLATGPDSPWAALLRAEAAEAAGKADVAEREFRRAISSADTNADMYVRYGQFLCKHSRFEEGLAAYEHAAKTDPLTPGISGLIGEVHMLQDRPKQAIGYLQKAVQANPREVQTRLYLAQALTKLSRSAEALKVLEAAPEDRDGRIHYALGRTYMQMGDSEKARKAMDVYRQQRGTVKK